MPVIIALALAAFIALIMVLGLLGTIVRLVERVNLFWNESTSGRARARVDALPREVPAAWELEPDPSRPGSPVNQALADLRAHGALAYGVSLVSNTRSAGESEGGAGFEGSSQHEVTSVWYGWRDASGRPRFELARRDGHARSCINHNGWLVEGDDRFIVAYDPGTRRHAVFRGRRYLGGPGHQGFIGPLATLGLSARLRSKAPLEFEATSGELGTVSIVATGDGWVISRRDQVGRPDFSHRCQTFGSIRAPAYGLESGVVDVFRNLSNGEMYPEGGALVLRRARPT